MVSIDLADRLILIPEDEPLRGLARDSGATPNPTDPTVDLLPAAVYVCAPDGTILRFNRRAAELWGRLGGRMLREAAIRESNNCAQA
jgi:hypothetical protein